MIVAQERLGAVRHPMHRPADLARRHQDREVFRIGAGLQSECAADILGDHPQALVGNAQDGGKSVAQRARTLRAAAQQIALVGRIVARGCAARLHRLHQDPLLDQSDPRHVPGGRDEAIDLLGVGLGVGRQSRPVDRDIARRFRPDLRRALANGLAQVDHRRTLLVVDGDELGAVLRGRQRLGDHDRDRLAHMAHGRAGEGGAMRNNELLAAPANQRRVLGDVADPFHVGGGQHREHAGHGLGRLGIDRTDIGKGVRGTHEIGIGLAGQRVVGRVTSEAAHQRIVLQARPVLRAAIIGLCIHIGIQCRGGSGREHVITESGARTGVRFGRSNFRHAMRRKCQWHGLNAVIASHAHALGRPICSPSPRARGRRCRDRCGTPARPKPRPARRRAARHRS